MRVIKRLLPVLLIIALIGYLGWRELSAFPTQGQRIAEHALEHLDAPYVFHRSGPDSFDCSGLLLHCFADEGITLPHAAVEIGTNEEYPLITDLKKLKIGDVVCFDTVEDNDPSDHVGVYLGKNEFVHASSTYKMVVISKIEDIYLDTFSGARRIADVDLSLKERIDLFIESFLQERIPEATA